MGETCRKAIHGLVEVMSKLYTSKRRREIIYTVVEGCPKYNWESGRGKVVDRLIELIAKGNGA
jgi:hypothetical protein